ncbi:protein FRA10AC1 homolog [Drosophila erecta]|uniref:FRA10AC1 n=1 Tax=Drosophila erecta TaxID=7220 RepID=B3NAE2_DROER|nr:protein FRA10AC1 homolog [Drosophila erecta]EDV58644.1 uncharacterized protein Dere_GG10185 [Drosophila erecta]
MSGSQLFPVSLSNLSAKERHDYILSNYVLNSPAEAESRRHKRDIDVIRENHRFLWEDDELDTDTLSWEQRLALRYYRKLFKEYCIADLSRYKENKIALRWRTEQEVVTGTGQFQCGSRHCEERDNLRSWEVNFKYIEKGVPLNALVKVRLCPTHTDQLNYRTKKRECKKQQRRQKKELRAEKKRKRRKLDDKQKSSGEDVEETVEPASESQPEASKKAAAPKEDTTADEQIWLQQPDLSQAQTSREHEFERYLEDLLF